MKTPLTYYLPFFLVMAGLTVIFFLGGFLPMSPMVLGSLYFLPMAASAVTSSPIFVVFVVVVAFLFSSISLGRVDLVLWSTLAVTAWFALFAVLKERRHVNESWQEYRLLADQHVATQDHFDNFSSTLIRKNQDLENRVIELSTLHGLSTAVSSTTDLKKIYTHVSDAVSKLCSYDCFVFWETDMTEKTLSVKEVSGVFSPWRKDDTVQFDQGLIGRYAAWGRVALIEDVKMQTTARPTPEEEWFKVLLIVPVAVDGQPLGLMLLARADDPAFTRSEFYIIQNLASQVAAAIHRSWLYRRLESMAITDGLTGLYNRRHFEDTLRREFTRAERYQLVLSVVLLDVDHFKHYNDTNGHQAGDKLLQKVSLVLRDSIREVDLAARYGGEEFILVLPETPRDQAYQVAERIRLRISELAVPGAELQPLSHLSVSIGVASFPFDAADLETLVKCADKALYAAKESGRNQVLFFNPGQV